MAQHTILVIGDDPQTRQTLAALLDLGGFTVVTENDGAGALNRLNAGIEPCLILLDLAMPGTNAADFRRVQEAHPGFSRFAVAVISANPKVEYEARRLGIQDFLRKPILVDAVIAIVNRHCNRRHS